jgi:CheY-like chemotaxis protein
VREVWRRRGKFLEQQRYQLCLTDMRLPDGEGLEIVG